MKELVVLIMPGRTAVKTLAGTYPNQIDEMVRVLGYPPYPYPNNHLLSSSVISQCRPWEDVFFRKPIQVYRR